MRVAVIGAGKMGQAIARLGSRAGHEVVLANSRDPETLADLVADLGQGVSAANAADAAASADVVVLATPWPSNPAAISAVSQWGGKILVDTTNNRQGPGPAGVIDIGGRGSSEVVAELAQGARVVKAFNHVAIHVFSAALANGDEANALYIAGDDPEAKATVGELIASMGGTPIDAGPLVDGGRLISTDGKLSEPLRMRTPATAKADLEDVKSGSY